MTRRKLLSISNGLGLLSLLPSLRESNAQPTRPVKHLILMFPNGYFRPAWGANGFSFSGSLAPLAAVSREVTVIRGLNNLIANDAPAEGGHTKPAAGFLTAAKIEKATGATMPISADQALGELSTSKSGYRCLVLGPASGFRTNPLEKFNPLYLSTISWDKAGLPVPPIKNPGNLFDLLFPSSNPNEALKRKSALDLHIKEIERIKMRASTDDRRRLDQYLTSAREVERRLSETGSDANCKIPGRPLNVLSFEEQTRVMIDLALLALECDLTSVVSYYLDFEFSARVFRALNIYESHHSISHYNANPSYPDKLATINRWYVEQFVYALEQIKTKGLDRQFCVVLGGGMGNPNNHELKDLPIIVGARGGGLAPKGTLDMRSSGSPPIANLWLTLLKNAGSTATRFGNSSGLLGV
jgi:hypothetical protein